MLANIIFDTAKPIPSVQEILQIATNKNAIILDFYCGFLHYRSICSDAAQRRRRIHP